MLTEDEFSDLDDTDTFGNGGKIEIWITVKKHQTPMTYDEGQINIPETIQIITNIIENKIQDHGIITKNYGITRTGYNTHTGTIDIVLYNEYNSNETLQMLEQIKGTYRINKNTIWTTNATEHIEYIKNLQKWEYLHGTLS